MKPIMIKRISVGVVIVLSLFTLTQCASVDSQKKPEARTDLGLIDGLVIVNHGEGDLTNMKMTVSRTGQMVGVSRVLGSREFSTYFPSKRYQGNPVSLTWTQDGRQHTSPHIIFSLPRSVYQDQPVTAYLVIESNYQVRALIR